MAYCTHLEWAEEPHIIPCAIGEPADFRGLKIFAVYNDGSKVPVDVSMKMFHETNMQEVGSERSAHVVYEKKKLPVSIPLKDATLLRIEAAPVSPLTFQEEEEFDRKRAAVTAHYSDGTSREIDNYKIAPYLPLTANDKTITFRYGRSTFELPLTVLSQDAPASPPETIDVPKDTQAGNSVEDIPSNSQSSAPAAPASSALFAPGQPPNAPQAPIQTQPQTPPSTAAPVPAPPTKTVVAISVAKKPNHQKYLVGDTLVDLKGGRLDIIYSDGTVGQIDMIADGPVYIDSKKPGAGSISFTCLGSPVSFPIDVLEPKITKLSISKMPAKVDYEEGEVLNLAGLVLEAVYNDGSTRVVRGLQSNGLRVDMGHAEEGVTLSYEGEPFTIKINVKKKDVPVTALSIELAQEPDKTKYIENDPGGLDLSGAAILVQMSDGRRKRVPVTKNMVDPVDLSKPGRCLLNIRYMGFSVSCPILVYFKTIEKIELRSGPKETEYIEGENVDLRGVIVDACYNNGEREVISDYEVTPEVVSVSDHAIIFRYKHLETSVPITVNPLQVTLLDWLRQPTKTVYYTHEKSFSCSGGILRVKRNNGTEEEVALTPEMVTGFRTDRSGPVLLHISYAGKVIPFSITVQERTLLGLRVTHKPRLEYTEGEEFDPKGLVVEAVYSGETAEVVGVTYLPYGPLSVDTASVMLVYQDKAVVMPVAVSKPKSPEHLPIIPTPLNPDAAPQVFRPAKEIVPEPMIPESAPKPAAEPPAPAPEPDKAMKEPEETLVSGERHGDTIEDPFKDTSAAEEGGGKLTQLEPDAKEPAPEPDIKPDKGKKKRKSSVPPFYPSTFGMRFMEEQN